MTSKEVHKLHIQEHIQGIESAIAVGLEERAATIGLHTSACSIDLLELYLHTLNKISIGTMVKHEWFKTPKPEQKIMPLAERMLGVEFAMKEDIFRSMYLIEEHRNKLIYGKPSKSAAEIVLKAFQKLHQLIKEQLQQLGEEIE